MNGFTLIEALLYMALFSILMSGTIAGMYVLTESANRNQTQALVETEGNFLLSKISYELQQAQSMSVPTQNGTAHTIQLTSSDDTQVGFSIVNGALIRTENTVPTSLSGNDVTVQFLSATSSLYKSGNSLRQEIDMQIQVSAHSKSGQMISEDFFASSFLFP